MRASRVAYLPASLNESGVALMTAMIIGRSTCTVRPRAVSCAIGQASLPRRALFGHSYSSSSTGFTGFATRRRGPLRIVSDHP